jgi:hypothetical protein
MTTYARGSRRTRQAIASIAATILVGAAFAGSVTAASPGNDDIGSATMVGALPYADGPYDTTEATTGATDPGFCFEPDAGPDRSSVWYSFTPTASDSYLADTFGSDYDTTLYVGTPDGLGGIDVINCNDDTSSLQSAVRWDALAGTTYLLMVGTCCGGGVVGESGGGGALEFHVNVAPPPLTVNLTVDGNGSFTPYGTATIRGTIACSGEVQFVEIGLDVAQRVGRFTIRGFGAQVDESCPTSPTPWSIDVTGDNGKFLGGAVQVNAFAFACGAFECADDFVSRTVRLRR